MSTAKFTSTRFRTALSAVIAFVFFGSVWLVFGLRNLAASNVMRPAASQSVLASTDIHLYPDWISSQVYSNTRSLVWCDIDNDGDLDLAVGNYGEPNEIYLNNGRLLEESPAWQASVSENTTSLAFADMDSDGDLDLVVGNEGQPVRVYTNVNGVPQSIPSWSAPSAESTRSIAIGDVNGDGRYDLGTRIK